MHCDYGKVSSWGEKTHFITSSEQEIQFSEKIRIKWNGYFVIKGENVHVYCE